MPIARKAPRLVGLDRLAAELIVQPKVAPAACVGVARHHGRWYAGVGAAGHLGNAAASEQSIFDLASVTKPFLAVTAAVVSQSGAVDLDAELRSLMPLAEGTACASVNLSQLLSHRAGLLPHIALYAPLSHERPFSRVAALKKAANARRSDTQQPMEAVYSDLGYILAGEALRIASSRELDELIVESVCRPLFLEVCSARQWLSQTPDFLARAVPTEVIAWRGGILRGVVHDENAWALSGHATSGHAGLFGTCEGVLRFGIALLDVLKQRRTELMPRDVLGKLVQPRSDSSLRAGFDSPSGPAAAAGRHASAATFGHLGFTGTSLWCDPEREQVSVILTNRVHPTRTRAAIKAARPKISDLLTEYADDPASALRPA